MWLWSGLNRETWFQLQTFGLITPLVFCCSWFMLIEKFNPSPLRHASDWMIVCCFGKPVIYPGFVRNPTGYLTVCMVVFFAPARIFRPRVVRCGWIEQFLTEHFWLGNFWLSRGRIILLHQPCYLFEIVCWIDSVIDIMLILSRYTNWCLGIFVCDGHRNKWSKFTLMSDK